MRHAVLKLKLVASNPLLVLLVLTPVLLFGVAGRYFLNNQAAAVTNSTINFQARLMTNTGSIAADGDYNVEFKLYSALTSSGSSQGSCTGDAACLWTETRTSANKIHVANGYISANLGSVTSFATTINWDQQLYLTMNIGGSGSPTWDGEMTPRLKLTAVPYAFRASQLAALAGSHTGVLQFAASLAQDSVVTLPDPGAGTATVCYQASTACGFVTGASTNFIQNGTSVQAAANFNIRSVAAGSVVAVIQGTTSQTADLLDVQTWNGTSNTTVFGVGANGQVTLGGGLSPDITTVTAATSNGISLQPGVSSGASTVGAGTTIKAGDVSGTTTVTGGTLALQGGSATGGSGSRTGGSVTIDAGTGATAAGSITIGGTAASTISLGSTTLATGTQTINVGANNTGGSTTNVTVGSGSSAAAGATTVRAHDAVTITAGAASTWSTSTGSLTIQGGGGVTINTPNSAAASTNGITIKSGDASTGTNLNAGTVAIDTGTQTGTGTAIINLGVTNGRAINVGSASSTTTLTGTIKIATALGAATANAVSVCRDSTTTALISCDANTTGRPFLQGGNSFGAGVAGDLGTNDASALNLRTSGTTRLTVGISGGVSLASGNALTVTSGATSLTGATSGDALTVSNSTSTGNIAVFKDNATAVATIADGGSVLLQNTADSAAAFQIQNALGNGVAFDVDTANTRIGVGTATPSYNLSFGAGANRTIGVETQTASNTAGNNLTATAGGGNGTGAGGIMTIQGGPSGTGAAAAGGAVIIQGGTAGGTGVSNGGKVTIQGGTAAGTGVKGLIELNGSTYFTTGSYSSGSTATITQSLIDSNSAILATATVGSLTFTVPSPTNGASQAGRVLYIVNAGANAFTLSFASSNLSLSAGATATLIWSGTAWTGAGADSATLQNDYANSLGGTTPEIILDATRKGIDIQDANGGYVGSNAQLLAVRTGAASGLGNPLLTVTNSGGNSGTPLVGIGVETATRTLQLSVNNSTTSGGPLLIDQAGAGDSSMEYKSTGGSFYTGIDSSDSSKFKINSSVAAGTSATFGRTTIAASTDSGDVNIENASKFTMGASAGTMSSMSVYINSGSSSNSYSVALYADNAGVPGAIIASSTTQFITPNAWNSAPITAGLSASTNYWLAFNTNDTNADMRFDNTGTSCFTSRTFALGWPPTFGACSGGTGIQNFSIYATYSLNSTTDTFSTNSLFSMSNTGQVTLQNYLNSSTAFQVLNSTGTTLLNVDTNTPTVNLGVTGATALAGTVNVGTSTGATQTINVGSATNGSASNGTTVLLQGGNTASAVGIQALASGTIGIGTNNAANTLQVGSTSLSSGTQVITIGTNNTSGGTTNITIGTGSTATAGTTILQSKTATNVTSSGAVTITAGATSTWSTTTGNINIQSGAASGTLNLTGGTATGATAAGAVNIQGGAAAATAGSSGGGINILGAVGTATGTGGAGGTLYFSAGNAQGSGNNAGGNITLNLGSSTGTGAQGTFQVQNALGANLLTVDPSNTAASLNLISNSGAETGSPPTGWAAQGAGSSVATGTGTDAASGAQSAKVTFGTSANAGVKTSFTTAPTASTTVNYIVSFTAKLVSGTALSNTLQVVYSPDNGTTLTATCSNYSTQGLTTTGWTKVSCTFVPGSTTVTTALLIMRQTDAPGTSRVIDIDNLSVVQQNSTGTSNVGDLKVGGSNSQGLTLLTLDTFAANPFTGTNASLAGSMYFDTTQGKIQCYDGSSWGACGAAPNNIITLSPEYAGAVLHQSGSSSIGTMTSDFCSSSSPININDGTSGQPSICNANQTFNFYRWTSPQGTAQQYSVWVTYQLPSTFKNFVSGTTTLTGRTDSTNSTVQYTIYKNVGGTSTACSANKVVSTGVQSNWQVQPPTTDPSTCSFAAGNTIVIEIDVISNSNANAYVSNLNFAFSNQ